MIHFFSFWSNIFQITKNDDHRHFQKIFVTSHNKQILSNHRDSESITFMVLMNLEEPIQGVINK